MGYIKTFDEFINEDNSWNSRRNLESGEDLYKFIITNYENLGKEDIEIEKGKDDRGIAWSVVTVPVTLSGLKIETEPWAEDPTKTFAIDINPDLEEYLDPDTYDELDDQILDQGVLRVYTNPGMGTVTNDDFIRVLDSLLSNVPDPALRKKIA